METIPTKILKILLCATIVLNTFDIVLHIAINQPEILRIMGNVLIILSSVTALVKYRPRLMLGIGLVCYLVLNGVFIAVSGIGGAGIALISATTAFMLLSLSLKN